MLQHPIWTCPLEGGAPLLHEQTPAFVFQQGFPDWNQSGWPFDLEEATEQSRSGATLAGLMLDETVPGQSRDRLLAKKRLELGGSINR